MLLRTFVAIALAFSYMVPNKVWAQPASAACDKVDAVAGSGGTPATGVISDCLKDLRTLIGQLQGQQGLAAGVVIAFASPSPTVVCPTGFSVYTDARDRMIVGAGNKYGLGATGGLEMVTLGIEHIPAHSHRVSVSNSTAASQNDHLAGNELAAFGIDPIFVAGNIKHNITETMGGGQPHENMPPFVALFFCKKD